MINFSPEAIAVSYYFAESDASPAALSLANIPV